MLRALHVEIAAREIPAGDVSCDWEWTVIRVLSTRHARSQSIASGSAPTWDDAVEDIRSIEPDAPGDAGAYEPRAGVPPRFVWRSHP